LLAEVTAGSTIYAQWRHCPVCQSMARTACTMRLF
jgi:hypothetical protein